MICGDSKITFTLYKPLVWTTYWNNSIKLKFLKYEVWILFKLLVLVLNPFKHIIGIL